MTSHPVSAEDFQLAATALQEAANSRVRAAEIAAGELDSKRVADRRTPSVKIADYLREANRLRKVAEVLELQSQGMSERQPTEIPEDTPEPKLTVVTNDEPVDVSTGGDADVPKSPFMLPAKDLDDVLKEESDLDSPDPIDSDLDETNA